MADEHDVVGSEGDVAPERGCSRVDLAGGVASRPVDRGDPGGDRSCDARVAGLELDPVETLEVAEVDLPQPPIDGGGRPDSRRHPVGRLIARRSGELTSSVPLETRAANAVASCSASASPCSLSGRSVVPHQRWPVQSVEAWRTSQTRRLMA